MNQLTAMRGHSFPNGAAAASSARGLTVKDIATANNQQQQPSADGITREEFNPRQIATSPTEYRPILNIGEYRRGNSGDLIDSDGSRIYEEVHLNDGKIRGLY